MKFEFTAGGRATLRQLDNEIIDRILRKIFYWENIENPLKYASKVKGHPNLFRYRIGDWRLVVSPNQETGAIDILRVGHRSKVYKNLNK